METLKTQVLIIGGGASGLNAALHLNSKSVILVEKRGSNSAVSFWNLMVKPKGELREKILKTGNYLNNRQLVETFLSNYKSSIDDLEEIGIKLRKSNIGLIPDYKFPGVKIRKIFLKRIERRTNVMSGKVTRFLTDEEGNLRGAIVERENQVGKIKIFFDYLILAAGGISGLFKFTTGSKSCDGSILSLCLEAGLVMEGLEFFMYHPFLIVDKRFPRVLISGEILTKMGYEDGKGNQFLSEDVTYALKSNKHHSIFFQMAREFSLKAVEGPIFGRLVCSNEWFEKFKRENEFGFIFKNFKKDDIGKIEFHPAFHFLVGGVAINQRAQTSQENVYAAGEITGGLHGSNRVGGLAILEALVFSKIAALEINKKIKKFPKKLTIPKRIKEIGNLGVSETVKKKIWETLGPVKKRESLRKFKKFLEAKSELSSQEKLIKKIVELRLICDSKNYE